MPSAVRVVDRLRDMADWAGVPSKGAVRYDTATQRFSTTPTKTVFASDVATLDADPVANTGTDVSAAINAVLAGGNVRLVLDGIALCRNAIRYTSNTSIEGAYPGAGLMKKGAPNDGLPLLWNANPNPTGTPATTNAAFRNLTLYGNRANDGSGNDGSVPALTDPLYRATANLSGYYVPSFVVTGASGLTLDNVTVHDSPMAGFFLANVWDSTLRNVSKWSRAGDFVTSNDILDVLGGCRRVKVFSLGGTASDDAIAIAPNSVQDFVAPQVATFDPAMARHGPVWDIFFNGVSVTCANLMRIMSGYVADYADDIVIKNAVASLTGLDTGGGYSVVILDDFGTGDGSHGRIGRVVCKNIKASGTYLFPSYPLMVDRANVELLEVDGFQNVGYTQVPAVATFLNVTGNATFGRIRLRGVRDEATNPVVPSVRIAALAGGSLEIGGHEYDLRRAGSTLPQPLFSDVGMVEIVSPINELSVTNSRAARVSNLVRITGASPNTLSVTGSRLLGSKGGAAVQADVALTRATVEATDADHFFDAPAAGMTKAGLSWHAERYFRSLFPGADGDLLSADPAWLAVGVGANALKKTGDGWVYLGGASSFTAIDQTKFARPLGDSWAVTSDLRRLTALATGELLEVVLFATGIADLTETYSVALGNGAIALLHNSAVVQSTTSLPALAAVWRLRAAVYGVPGTSDKRVVVQSSTDGGIVWLPLLATGYFTTVLPATPGIRGRTALGGWAAATGYHVGALVVTDFSQVIPSPLPPTYLSAAFTAADGTHANAYTPEVGPVGVEDVGSWTVAGNALGAAIQTATDGGFNALYWDAGHTTGTLSTTMVVGSQANAGLMLNWQDRNNYYVVRALYLPGAGLNTWSLNKRAAGSLGASLALGGTLSPGTYTLKVVIDSGGDRLTAFANDVQVLTYTEASRPFEAATKYGYWTYTGGGGVTAFDDLGTTFDNLLMAG